MVEFPVRKTDRNENAICENREVLIFRQDGLVFAVGDP